LAKGVDPATKDLIVEADRTLPSIKTFDVVSVEFLEKHVRRQALRSAKETERILGKELLPRWKEREFASIRRSDVSALLDEIEARAPVQADRVLAVISKMCNWHAACTDEYVSPIVRGMRRSDSKSRNRARTLDAEEISSLWQISTRQGVYGAFVQFALLTGQRKSKVSSLRWSDIDTNGIWRIPM